MNETTEKRGSKKIKGVGLIALLLVVIIFPVVSGLNVLKGLKDRKTALDLSVVGKAPSFTFKDLRGDIIQSEQFNGSLLIAGFNVETNTPAADSAYKKMAAISELFTEDNGIVFANFIVKETDDTITPFERFIGAHPKVLSDKKSFFFKISAKEFQDLSTQFHVPQDVLTGAKAYFVLVDKRGSLRKVYNALNKKSLDSLAVAAIMLPKKIDRPEMKK